MWRSRRRETYRRDRRPGTRTVQRIRRPLSEGGTDDPIRELAWNVLQLVLVERRGGCRAVIGPR
jgi:hypothetical protein